MLVMFMRRWSQLLEVSGALINPHVGIWIEHSDILQYHLDIMAKSPVAHIKAFIITITSETNKKFHFPSYTCLRFPIHNLEIF